MIVKLRAFFEDSLPPPSPPVVSPPPPPPPPAPRTFTQAEVDKLMAEHRKGLQSQNGELVKQLEELRATANLTQKEKEDLDARITTLQQTHLTKEQQQASELDKLSKKYKTDTESLTTEGAKWKKSFNDVLIENAIRAGAATHTAASAAQMLDLLSGKAKVVEVLDDAGKPTGKYAVKMPVTTIDPKTKQPVVLELDMVEAIGKMREIDENANLFLTDGKPGYGGQNGNRTGSGGSSGTPDFAKMTAEQYSKWRKEQGYAPK